MARQNSDHLTSSSSCFFITTVQTPGHERTIALRLTSCRRTLPSEPIFGLISSAHSESAERNFAFPRAQIPNSVTLSGIVLGQSFILHSGSFALNDSFLPWAQKVGPLPDCLGARPFLEWTTLIARGGRMNRPCTPPPTLDICKILRKGVVPYPPAPIATIGPRRSTLCPRKVEAWEPPEATAPTIIPNR